MQNRKPDRAEARRAHAARHAADFLALERKNRAGLRNVRSIELKSEHPLFQTAARSRPLDRFLAEVASFIERDQAIETPLERDRFIRSVDADSRNAILDPDDFEHRGVDSARTRRLRENRGDRRINRIARTNHGYGWSAVARQVTDTRAARFDEVPRCWHGSSRTLDVDDRERICLLE